MKFLTTLALTVLFSIAYGQITFEPDARIINNHGQEKAEELVKYRPNYYNYLVYQLNNTCSISEKKQAKKIGITTNQVFKNESGATLTKEIVASSEFNYTNWGIEPDPENTRVFQLSDGSFLKVLSIRALTDKFRVSPKNTKNLY
jgi:hypothetical protein